MASDDQLISGTNFIQVRDFIMHQRGSYGWEAFTKAFPKHAMDDVYEERMYPFRDYVGLLVDLKKHFNEDDIANKIGWYRAKNLMLAKGKKRTGWQILTIVAVAWHKFNNFGRVEIARPDDRTIVIRMSDYFSDPLYCDRMGGFFGALASQGSRSTIEMKEESCVCRGDDACVFVIRHKQG